MDIDLSRDEHFNQVASQLQTAMEELARKKGSPDFVMYAAIQQDSDGFHLLAAFEALTEGGFTGSTPLRGVIAQMRLAVDKMAILAPRQFCVRATMMFAGMLREAEVETDPD